MSSITIGFLQIAMKYLQQRPNRASYYYRRLIPDEVRSHYAKPELFFSLKTEDKALAIKLCEKYTRQYDEEFYRIRNGLPKEKVSNLHGKAIQRLKDFNVSLKAPDSIMKDLFYEHLDTEITKNLSSKEYEKWMSNESALPDKALNSVDRAAFAIIKGEYRLNASQYPDEYLRIKHWKNDKVKVNECRNAVRFITEYLEDQPPGDFTRYDVGDLILKHLEVGSKTRTVERKLKSIRAMFNIVNLELDLKNDRDHPFHTFNIPRLGEDSTDRLDLTHFEIDTLREVKTLRKPEIPLIMKLLLDTGMRMSECCGLKTEDIKLATATPYVIIHRNSFRRLKTKSSQRFIPLVASSLEAAEEALTNAKGDWLFPNYIDLKNEKVKVTTASNAIAKRIKTILGNDAPTAHSLRHTFYTRLRNVNCPKDTRDELGGWQKTQSDACGTPQDLKIKAEYISASINRQTAIL